MSLLNGTIVSELMTLFSLLTRNDPFGIYVKFSIVLLVLGILVFSIRNTVEIREIELTKIDLGPLDYPYEHYIQYRIALFLHGAYCMILEDSLIEERKKINKNN